MSMLNRVDYSWLGHLPASIKGCVWHNLQITLTHCISILVTHGPLKDRQVRHVCMINCIVHICDLRHICKKYQLQQHFNGCFQSNAFPVNRREKNRKKNGRQIIFMPIFHENIQFHMYMEPVGYLTIVKSSNLKQTNPKITFAI